MTRNDATSGSGRRSGSRRVLARKGDQGILQDASFHYELANLTSYGGDTGFPILSDATLCNLRISHRHADGVTVEVPLHDSSGVRQVDLDTASVYLMSDKMRLPDVDERIEVTVTGNIRPTKLVVGSVEHRSTRSIQLVGSIVLETVLVPGLYELLHVVDFDGRRYPIGTIGMVISDPSMGMNTFAGLRHAASQVRPGAKTGSRLRRSPVR